MRLRALWLTAILLLALPLGGGAAFGPIPELDQGSPPPLRLALPQDLALNHPWLRLVPEGVSVRYYGSAREALLSLDRPDALAGFLLSAEDQRALAAEGLLQPLERLMPGATGAAGELLRRCPTARAALRQPDGHVYALPRLDQQMLGEHPDRFWINTAWLSALGLDPPDTPDSLLQVLRAFKQHDGNGNGQLDELPVILNLDDGEHSDSAGFLMRGFVDFPIDLMQGAAPGPGALGLYLSDHGVRSCLHDREAMRAGLHYIQTLVAEELLWAGSFDQNRAVDLMQGEAGLVGSGAGRSIGFALPGGLIYRQYDWLLPMKDAEGTRRLNQNPYPAFREGYYALSAASARPREAFAILDSLYAAELPSPPPMAHAGDKKSAEGQAAWLREASAAYAPYAQPERALPWPVESAHQAELNELFAVLQPMIREGLIAFMRGEQSLEGYDAWLSELNQAGLNTAIALYQPSLQ